MTEALTESIRYVFETESLHRIQANHLIGNEASAALLKKVRLCQRRNRQRLFVHKWQVAKLRSDQFDE